MYSRVCIYVQQECNCGCLDVEIVVDRSVGLDNLYFEERTGKDDLMGEMIQWIDVKTILLWNGENGERKIERFLE